MKKTQLLKAFIALLITTVGLTSCKKNEVIPDWPIPNEIFYDGQQFKLTHGIVKDWKSSDNNAADFDIALFTEGITINDEGQPENEGTIIYFNLHSFDASSLEDGKYEWSAENAPGTVTESTLVVDFDGQLTFPQTGIQMRDGAVYITRNDGEFTLNFILTSVDSKTLTGSYKGPLSLLTED